MSVIARDKLKLTNEGQIYVPDVMPGHKLLRSLATIEMALAAKKVFLNVKN